MRDMDKQYQKVFEVAGVKLRLKKLGLADFPTFKMLYAKSVDSNDEDGIIKAYLMLYSWLEQNMLGEWVPVFNKKEECFSLDILNEVENADRIIDVLLSEILPPLFLNTAELKK